MSDFSALPERFESIIADSIDLLERAAFPAGATETKGFVASPDDTHYRSVWGRDASIAGLGALATTNQKLHDATRATLETLLERRSHLGQVPDAVWTATDYWDWGEGGCTDATAWMPILLGSYVSRTGDTDFGKKWLPAVLEGLTWLRYQDANNMGLIDAPRAGDWMDSSLGRSGKVLHVNALLLWALRSTHWLIDKVDAEHELDWQTDDVSSRLHQLFWPADGMDHSDLWRHVPSNKAEGFAHKAAIAGYETCIRKDREHYLSSVEFGGWMDRCDTLGNLLTILTGTVPAERANRILDHLGSTCADPFPSRSWQNPIERGDRSGMLSTQADETQDPRWRNAPGRYHNGAVWPYIGGFHVAALALLGRDDEALSMLGRLTEANRLGDGFHEWIGLDGQVGGPSSQTWNAGSLLYAVGLLNTRLL